MISGQGPSPDREDPKRSTSYGVTGSPAAFLRLSSPREAFLASKKHLMRFLPAKIACENGSSNGQQLEHIFGLVIDVIINVKNVEHNEQAKRYKINVLENVKSAGKRSKCA